MTAISSLVSEGRPVLNARAMNLARPSPISLGLALALGLAVEASADSVVERLIASYDAVESVQVEIRRDTHGPGGRSRRLSRVYFQRPDRLHVETVTAPRRRIVADGAMFYSYIDGDPKGYACPIEALEGDWLISLRQAPGTPMDHLLRVRGLPEESLPGADNFPVRVGLRAAARYVVLNLDPTGRLARVEFFTDPSMSSLLARYEYENYVEPLPGVWFPLLQKAGIIVDGRETVETTRLSNLAVNQPIPAPLFRHDTFFDGVVFTDNLDEIYR
jgi:hypothetical protein